VGNEAKAVPNVVEVLLVCEADGIVAAHCVEEDAGAVLRALLHACMLHRTSSGPCVLRATGDSDGGAHCRASERGRLACRPENLMRRAMLADGGTGSASDL
jgi:hypothetical protein